MKKTCKNCDTEFETRTKRLFCSDECKKTYLNREEFPDGSDFVVCKECGLRQKQLTQHIMKMHHMSVDDYCSKHNCTLHDLTCESLHNNLTTHIRKACVEGRCGWQKGENNPSHSEKVKSGRSSPFSMNYHGYDGLIDEEKRERIADLAKNIAEKREKNGNSTTSKEYYIKRGYSEEEAIRKLKERQRTFTLEKCIEKYGEDEGKRVFEERQKKWQNTLNSKPIEELCRIYNAKMCDGRGYSKVSQELFKAIMSRIGNRYKEVFYATSNPDSEFSEYMVCDKDGTHRYFLDFYVKDNNKVIEFDGDYWHGPKRGNKKRDMMREEALKRLGYENIFHVKERDYRNNPEKVISDCVAFILE